MSSLILWLDTEEALLFHLLPTGVQRERMRRRGPRHKVEALGINHPIEQTDEERFYHSISLRLAKVEADEWLLVGPGPARDRFLNHIERHHPELRPRICAAQKMEKLTDAQIVDAGKEFFRNHHVYASAP